MAAFGRGKPAVTVEGERLIRVPQCWNAGRRGLGERPHPSASQFPCLEGGSTSSFLTVWWQQDEAARVKVNEKVCGGAAALSLLLGEEGYTIIVKLLTAKVMQGLRSIRVPVIIYRKKKNTLHCENQMAWQINAPSFGERILKAKVV